MPERQVDLEGVPPPYTPGEGNPPSYQDLPPKKVDLPPYQDSYQNTPPDSCPSYQNTPPDSCPSYPDPPAPASRRFHFLSRDEALLSVETLGTDSVFILCFIVCFLFSWIGYIICCCLFTSVAARCGAVSGIGLNIVKMLLILKRCSFANPQVVMAQEYLQLHEFQYILLMALGLITLLFGVIKYNSAKASFNRQVAAPPMAW